MRNDIVSGELPVRLAPDHRGPGDRYGVSHMPIREALRVLHGEGLVVIEPNRGARVRPIYRGFIEDLFDVRCAIETMLARRAAERRTARASRSAARGRGASSRRTSRPATTRRCPSPTATSTRSINDAAGNPGALPIVDSHWLLLAALLKRYGYGDDRFQRVIEEHQHLIQAIERRDAHSAAMLMGAHIEKAKNNLLHAGRRERGACERRRRRRSRATT